MFIHWLRDALRWAVVDIALFAAFSLLIVRWLLDRLLRRQ